MRARIMADLYNAVWMYHVQSRNMLRGWLTEQGKLELNEACAMLCWARRAGMRIPSFQQACDYYNNGD